jgi:hypothetical protein
MVDFVYINRILCTKPKVRNPEDDMDISSKEAIGASSENEDG